MKSSRPRRKLIAGDHVEVRSTEDGFHGSWHSAVVLECGDSFRRVRYDNLLVDDGSDILVESITVSSTVDGVFPVNGIPVNYRGVIRPAPPPLETDRWSFHYGLCVDAYVNEAWWEGVVFDYEAGADRRLVFFPDLGDEQTVEIVNLRVTRDWDEVTERWIERGDWLFLRLVEEQEKELFFCASVSQLWYDARTKEDFRVSIKEWTCWIRPMWDDIVREVICDNIDLTAEHFLSLVKPQSSQVSVEDWSNTASSGKSDTSLRCEGSSRNHVEKDQMPWVSNGPSKRTRSRCANESIGALPSKAILQDNVEGNQFAFTSSGPSQRTGSSTECDSLDNEDGNRIVSSLQGPSKRTRGFTDNSNYGLPCTSSLQDNVEGNQLWSSSQSQRPRGSTLSDNTLPRNGTLQDTVEESHLALSLLFPSKRRTRSITDKSDFTLHCEGILQDHVEENQLAVSSSGRSQRTNSSKPNARQSCEGNLQHNVEKKRLVLSSPSSSKRTGSTDESYFTRHCEDNLQDFVEENQLALGSPEKTRLKRKSDSSNMHSVTKKFKGSFEPKLGGQVDKRAALRFQIVRDANGGALTIKGNLGVLPMKKVGKSGLSDDRMENVNSDSEAICSDPNLISQFNSVADNREHHKDDSLNARERMVIQDALKYLRVARDKSCPREPCDKRNAVHKVRKHLLDMGWEIKHVKDERTVRVQYITPKGRIFYSLIKLCETLIVNKELITTRCSQNVNENSVDSSVPLNSIVQQVAFGEGLQQNSVSEGCGATPLGKDAARNRFKRKTGPTCGDTGNTKFDMLKNEAMLNYPCTAKGESYQHNRKCVMNEVQMHLLDMGWEIKRFTSGNQCRTCYNSPSGKKFYSLAKVCENLETAKDTIMAQCTSPSPNYKVYSSLQPAREGCIEQGFSEDTWPVEGTTVDKEYKDELTQCKLTSIIVCDETGKCLLPEKNHTDMSGLSESKGFKFRSIKVGVRGPRKRAKHNSWPFASKVHSMSSYTRQESILSYSKTRGESGLNYSSPGRKKQNSVRTPNKKGDKLDGSCPSRVLRSLKRARRVRASNPEQFTPQTILSWLIDNNVVLPREKVFYRRKNQHHPVVEGRITRDGIKCSCCQKVYGISSFEAHAGSPCHCPAENMFLEDGRSLLDCQKEMLQKTKLTDCTLGLNHKFDDKNDCICSVCRYGGTLLLCDQCPSSFHLSCIGLEKLPKGKWFCPACRCAICGLSDFNEKTNKFTDKSVLCCDQCERQYHVGCSRKKRAVKFRGCLKENWFCSDTCEKIFMGLHRLLGKSINVGMDNLSWTILKFSEDHVHKDASNTVSMVEHHSKLNVALAVMHECFEPIEEPQTKDLVKDVLFNRRSVLKRLDFRGFYTVLLEKEDEVISVAIVRVYGGKVAEVPLVGTRFHYRRQGMCRVLMDLLEKKLAQFGVERLLLPAIPQVLQAWTTSFGFSKMTDSERIEFLEYTFLDFPGTTMCQKLLKNAVTLKVIGPKEGDFIPKVSRKNGKSDAMKQMAVEVATHAKGSVIETLSPVNQSTQPWSNCNSGRIESDGKQKEDKDGEKRFYLKYYRRRIHGQESCHPMPVVTVNTTS